MAAEDDPVIRVGPPTVAKEGGGTAVVHSVLVLDCSACGELDSVALSIPQSDLAVVLVKKEARDHANAEHDGLAVNVGWSW